MAQLRAVRDGDPTPAAGSKKKSVAEAASKGTHRELLEAMRDRIAIAVTDPKCPPRDLAALTRRLDDIADKLKALDDADSHEAAAAEPVSDSFDASAI